MVARTLPQNPGLRIADLVQFLIHNLKAEDFLPPKWKKQSLDRDWLSSHVSIYFEKDLGSSLDIINFATYVDRTLSKWKKEKLNNNHLNIGVTSKFTKIFAESQMVSGWLHTFLTSD